MEYLGLIIGYLIIFLSPAIGLWHKRFPDLGYSKSAAFIPFYNYYCLLKAAKLPWYWVIFLLFPGAQFIMWFSLNVTYIRKFGEFGVKETILGILFPYPVFWKIANNAEKYPPTEPTNWDIAKQVNERKNSDHVALAFALPVLGHAVAWPLFSALQSKKKKGGRKTVLKECGDAILFAIIAASVIRTYVFEPFKIPTGSMEKTQLIGDHLFVDKITYGPRVPMTPFSYPVFHNFIPYLNVKSYLEIQKIPYTRLPGLRKVNRNDVVVFNYPAGDTSVYDPRMPYGLMGHNYHQILMDEAWYLCKIGSGKGYEYFEKNKARYLQKAYENLKSGKVYCRRGMTKEDSERGYVATFGLITRPIDKREHYIKRCVGLPGDVIEIKDKELYVNDELAFHAPGVQYSYYLPEKIHPFIIANPDGVYRKEYYFSNSDRAFFKKNFDVDNPRERVGYTRDGSYLMTIGLTNEEFEKARKNGVNIQKYNKEKGFYHKQIKLSLENSYFQIQPKSIEYDWTEDNFGPLNIPAKGDNIQLNKKNLPLYKRIITAYEGHDLKVKDDGIYIDGKKTETYTIEQDYYWLMGDNRNNSIDSRFWGFVPNDHVVGHAAFVFFSTGEKDGIRWERIFNKIK